MPTEPLDEEAIFKVASKISDPEAQATYLRQICGKNQALLDRMSALLRARDEEPGFLESPPSALERTIDFAEAPAQLGEQIGSYKLLQVIGEGGMGVVYMAEQSHPVKRRVALKVIKPGMDSRQVIARFDAERQALAMMDHPNIARVLEAGTTNSGLPYFVMELVRGLPITEYCDQHQLSPHERLGLFVQVCQAVQHAHQKGVIHRDIKPSNVLVADYDDQPVPKIIDFGLAKAVSVSLTEMTNFTRLGQVVGTFEYMSPEQAKFNQLDVDTRTDIYSLGVLLYELLTGCTPFDRQRLHSAAFDEMLRIIREEEPPKPSTRISGWGQTATALSAQRKTDLQKLLKLVLGDLDLIVMKALEKDRARRYESASGLAADVQRYLHDEQVLASPPSAMYRLKKTLRRHRGPVIAASLVVLCLVGGIVGTTAGMLEATKQKDAALAAEKEAVHQREEAARQRDEAESSRRNEERARKELQANLERLTATVGELREQWIDKGIQLSFAGDVERVRALCSQARLVNVPDDWLLTLEASALYHRGDVDGAFTMLSDAKLSNISAQAMLAVVYLEGRCDWIEFERRSVDLRKSQQSAKNIEDFDALFLAYAFAGYGVETSGELEAILQRNPHWMLAKAVRANEKAGQVDDSGDIDSLESALIEIESLIVIYPENRFLEMRYLWSLLHALEFTRHHRADRRDLFAELKGKATRVADALEDYPPARWARATIFDLVDDHANAIRAYRELGTRERPAAMFDAVGYFYRENNLEEARKVIDAADPARPETKIAKAYLLADQAEKASDVLALYDSLRSESEYDTWWIRALASKIPLLLGDLPKAEHDCQAWMDNATEADAVHILDRLDKASVAYLAKNGRVADEYLRADKSVAGKFYAYFTLGCESLAKGDRAEAAKYFNCCVANSRGWQAEANWARAFLKRLDDPEWPRACKH